MKKLLALAFALLITSPALAVDTTLNGVTLTEQQISQSNALKSEVVKGFAAWSDKVVVVSTRGLTALEIQTLRTELAALPNTYAPADLKAKFDTIVMRKRLFEILPTLSNFNLRLEVGAMEAFGESKNFLGMKQYLQMLVGAGVASADDLVKIKAVIVEQGIDLDSVA